ncbi:MAG TPA: carboxypeptidase-like regulatory domain-containing protein [Chitinophagaceae bacterium]|nr:carboxypeptidase-like regulatory domain-containing protein [Chitinophagaceae bacterium]
MRCPVMILLSILLLYETAAVGQTPFSCSLRDKDSGQPIAFATIKVLGKPYGAHADSTGKFTVNMSPSDTLLISCAGYETIKLIGPPAAVVLLTKYIKELRPVTIGKKQVIKTETLGLRRKSNHGWGPAGYGEEFAQRIDLSLKENEYCRLKKVVIPCMRFVPTDPGVLHIYSMDPKTGKPEKELLSRVYILNETYYRKGRFVVDLSAEDLYIDEPSFFVSFSWLNNEKHGPWLRRRTVLKSTFDIPEPITYHRALIFAFYEWAVLVQRDGKVLNSLYTVEVEKYSFQPTH